MRNKKIESPKYINFQHKNHHNTKQFLQQIHFCSIEQHQRKHMLRNRSLKQLFGDISAVEEHMRFSLVDSCNLKQKKEQQLKRQKQKNLPQKRKKSNHCQNNQYFAINNSIKSKVNQIMKINKKLSLNEGTKPSKGNKQQYHLKNKQDYNKANLGSTYEPQAYNWRKSLSREKNNDLINKQRNLKIQKIVQSQYYTTTNTTQQEINKKQNKTAKQIKNAKNRVRSSSSQFKKESLLKPKVPQNIFSPKSKKSKGSIITSKKNLLFTFGI